jgi:hypothetical protein
MIDSTLIIFQCAKVTEKTMQLSCEKIRMLHDLCLSIGRITAYILL